MFIRRLNQRRGDKTYTYLKLVENVWQKGKVVQKTLVNFGNIDNWSPEKVKALLAEFRRLMKVELPPSLEDIEHKAILNFGESYALNLLWERLGISEILKELFARSNLEFSPIAPIKVMTFNRLIAPKSELAVCEWVKDQYIEGIDREIPLHHYYRSLNFLTRRKGSLERALYFKLNNLFTLDFSLVFYDLTSTYFEGGSCPMAKKGYSRDRRPDRPQVNIGLLVNRDGIPISHTVFDGNLKDSTTLPSIIKKMQGEFNIKRCIFVGDKGIVTSKGLKELASLGYEYIVSIKLRRSKEADSLLSLLPPKDEFTKVKDDHFVWELPHQGSERYIACYNPLRAEDTRETRERVLKECEEFFQGFHLPPKQGRSRDPIKIRLRIDRFLRKKHASSLFQKPFFDEEGRPKVLRDTQGIAKEASLDGLFIIRTNSQSLSKEALAIGYKTLWEVESAFREVKDFIRVRPIYHYNPERVKGHIFVCFLAYLLEKLLEKIIEDNGIYMTARKALASLSSIKVVFSELAGQKIKKVSAISKEQEAILKALGVQDMPKILP